MQQNTPPEPTHKAGLSHSLQRRILYFAILGILTTVLMVSLTTTLPLYNYAKADDEDNLTEVANQRALLLEGALAEFRSIAMQVTSRTFARKQLEAFNRGEITNSRAIELLSPILQDAMSRSDDVGGISRLDVRHGLLVSVGKNIPKNLWPIPSADAGATRLLHPVMLDGEPYMVVGAPILDRQQNRVGTDLVLFNVSKLWAALQEHDGLGNTGHLMLGRQTESGVINFGPSAFNNMQKAANTTAQQQEILLRATQGNRGIAYSSNEPGTHFVSAFANIPGSDWGVVVMMEADELYTAANRQVMFTSGAVLLVLLVGSIATALFIRPLAGQIVIHSDELSRQIEERTHDAEEKAKKLKRSNEELDKFAYVASHDLKSPLRAIASLSEWIEEDLEGTVDEKVQKHLTLLRARVHRMDNLIDGILRYSRAGRVEMEIEAVDVNALVEEVIDSLSPPPEFHIDVAPDLPTLQTARVPLFQVFANLISNSIKHHDRTDGRITITARSITQNTEKSGMKEYYQFVVADNGPGIAPEYHNKVFLIFQTLKARDEHESTGIGLALIKRIVETLGGEINIEMSEGRGVEFRFTLPKTP